MRLLNRPLALLLALALAATGVLIAVEVIAFAVHGKPAVVSWVSWEHWARTTRWNRAVIKVWAIALVIVGLLLVLAQLAPRRSTRIQLIGHDESTDTAITRKGLARAVRAAVLDVDGIAKAETTTSSRKLRVTATANAHDKQAAVELTDPVVRAAQNQIDTLGLKHPIKVRATVREARS